MDYIQQIITCNFNLIEDRKHRNELLGRKQLPNINFRIDVEHGKVIMGISRVSSVNKIYGAVTAICLMINHGAKKNRIVMGEDMFMEAQSLTQYQYTPPIQYTLPNFIERTIYQVGFNQ